VDTWQWHKNMSKHYRADTDDCYGMKGLHWMLLIAIV
jgi:hypothetical protein